MTTAFVRRAWPFGTLLLVLATAFLMPEDRDYFPTYQHGFGREDMTVAMNLSLPPGFLYHRVTRRDDGRLRYTPYHRRPVTGHALTKLAMAPFAGDLSAQLEAARTLALLFWCAAAMLAYLALARLTGSRTTALLATLFAFSSHYMLQLNNVVANEVSMDLFGVALTFHGMVVFARTRRFGQLAAKACAALLLGWHAYALIGPFVVIGLAAAAMAAWRRAGRGGRLRALTGGLRRSRHALLGVVAVLFGAGVLGGNLVLESAALDDRLLMKTPTVHSILRRSGVITMYHCCGKLYCHDFSRSVFRRVGVAALPHIVYGWHDGTQALMLDIGPGGGGLVGGVGVVATILTAGLLWAGPHFRMLAPLALCGFCWALALPCQVYAPGHYHEGIFYFGVPLAGWALALLLLRHAAARAFERRGRAAPGGKSTRRWLGVTVVRRPQWALTATVLGTALAFAAGHKHWLKKNQHPREAATQRDLMAEFDAIRQMLDGRDVLVCLSYLSAHHALPIAHAEKAYFWDYLVAGAVPWYSEKLRGAAHWRQRGAPSWVLCPERVGVQSLRTPTHRHWFLYDSLGAVDAIAGAWRREYKQVDATPPVIRSAWNVHWDGGTLTYLKARCEDADMEGRFVLLVTSADGLPAGTDTWSDKSGLLLRNLQRFDDRCMMRIPLTNPRSVRTAFHPHRNERGARVWRATFRLDRDALRAAGRAAFGTAWAKPSPSVEGFRVRPYGNALVYVRAPCDLADDVEARFFLHATPVAAAAPPPARRQAGFENLDFDFGEHGAVVDGACVAEVPLPDHPVTDIRTGQFAAGAEIWSARLAIAAPNGQRRE